MGAPAAWNMDSRDNLPSVSTGAPALRLELRALAILALAMGAAGLILPLPLGLAGIMLAGWALLRHGRTRLGLITLAGSGALTLSGLAIAWAI